jgi:hypothetical protein
MKISLFLAHGEGLLPILFFVIPASLTGIGFLCASFASYCREKEGYKKRASIFAVIGFALLIAAYVAMRLSTGITRIS